MSAELGSPYQALRFSPTVRSVTDGNFPFARNPSAESSAYDVGMNNNSKAQVRMASYEGGSREDLAQLVQPFKGRSCLLQ